MTQRKVGSMRLFHCSVFLLVLLFSFSIGHSELASRAESDQVCSNWLILSVNEFGPWDKSDQPTILRSWDLSADNQTLARCYDISPGGFVVVPILKALPPIAAYSDHSVLDEQQTDGFLALLRESLQEKGRLFVAEHGALDAPKTSEAVAQQWQTLSLLGSEFAEYQANKGSVNTRDVGPLLTSSWHQREPYLDLCPMGQGTRCVVGCVATAAAQIINYWQWPDAGIGSHSYYWNGDRCDPGYNAQTLTADLFDPYDWANMIDSCDDGCSPEAEAALAELNYEVGVTYNMNYGSCGSAASTARALEALPQFFKYSHNILKADRDTFDLAGWFGVMETEIDAGRVGQYRINLHSIVMDGYREVGGLYQFHMNYGWGNGFSAWYTLDSLYCSWVAPDSICPADEEFIIINIEPESEPRLVFATCAVAEVSGDGDGHADAGEDISLVTTISNDGAPTTGVVGTLVSLDPLITITQGSADYDDNVAWTEQTDCPVPFGVHVELSCPDPYVALLEHTVTCNGGSSDVDTIQLFVGDTEGFADDMESGQADWRHYPLSNAYYDEWHLEDYRYHSAGISWKVGGPDDVNHTDNLNAALVTPPLLLPPQAHMSFWHWIDAEPAEDNGAYDGATIWIGTSDGQWAQLEPEGGYTHTFVSSSNPPGAGCFSGAYDWREEDVDLSAYQGVVQIMFLFYSDGYVTEEGWYVDDLEVVSGSCCQLRGDVNHDGIGPDIADLVFLVSYMFSEGPVPPCLEETDVDGSQVSPDIADLVYLVSYMFQTGPAPIACGL